MGFQKILVAFDGSEGSLKALHQGIDLTKEQNAELTVATVVKKEKEINPEVIHHSNPAYIPAGNETFVQQGAPSIDVNRAARDNTALHEERMRNRGDEILKEARKAIQKAQMTGVKEEVLEGSAEDQIERYAIAGEYDLIIIGSRGLSGLKKLMLGSVSQKVVQKAHCPVLVVK